VQFIHDLLNLAVDRYSDSIAVDAPDHQLTYGQLGQRVEYLTGALEALGIAKGDRVAILSPNCADYIVAQYAVSRLGAIFEVLNTRHVTHELVFAVNNAGASTIIVHQDCLEHLAGLSACPSIRFTVGLGAVADTTYRLDELIWAEKAQRHTPTLDVSAPAVLMYTSGTTGRPKGAIQSQQGSLQADLTTAELLHVTEADHFLAFMPFFHQAGLIRARAMLSRGAATVIADDLPANEIVNFMLEKHISMTMLVPPYTGKLLSLCAEKDIRLPDLRMIIGIAGPPLKDFCEQNRCQCMAVYGQTEVTGLITAIFDADSWQRPTSCGRVVPDMEIQICDDHGNPVPIGGIGEIMAKSKRCVPGYWENHEATKALYSGEWMHTGDLGRVDEDGFLYFINRKKELVKTGGENVYPIEVENVVRQHEDVLDMTIMGLPDADWGEAVTAVIVTRSGQEMSLNEVKQFCYGKLAGYKIPKRVHCIDEIPRNHTGKPNKLLLQERFG
jgi:fatty-acyl-CoA synthase